MLSPHSQYLLCKYLTTLSSSELSLESSRQTLISHPQFNPYSIFKRLDIEHKNFLISQNIISFLQDNSIFCSFIEAQSILLFYDSCNTNTLSYSQFLNLLLPEGTIIPNTPSNQITYPNFIPYSIEFLLCRILEQELSLIRSLHSIMNELQSQKDYSVYDIYHSLTSNTNSITCESIGLFLIANDFKLNDNEIKKIQRRLDIDKNGNVTIEDIEKLFTQNDKEYYIVNPKRNEYQTEKISSNLSKRNNPQKQNEYKEIIYPFRENQFSNINPCPKSNPFLNISTLPQYTNNEVVISFLKLLMHFELKIENLKIELAIRADFNIEDAFRLFEHTNPNFITEPDLKKGINSIGVFPSSEQIILLMNKYSLSGDNVLTVADVFDMLTPFTLEYRRDIEQRKGSPYTEKISKGDIFLTSTKMCMMNLFKFVIDAESLIEKERSKINNICGVNIRKVFNMIDKSSCGYFNIVDLNAFLKENGVSYSSKEADLLFIRLDKKREGKISLRTFIYETFPQIKVNHIK